MIDLVRNISLKTFIINPIFVVNPEMKSMSSLYTLIQPVWFSLWKKEKKKKKRHFENGLSVDCHTMEVNGNQSCLVTNTL